MMGKAIDEVCQRLTERYEQELREMGVDEDFIARNKTYHASVFKECTIHRVGFLMLLKELAKKPRSKKEIMEMVRKGIIYEDPILIPDYLERFTGILFEEENGTYRLTPLGQALLKEIKK